MAKTKRIHHLRGWIKDSRDDRDQLFRAPTTFATALPTSFDLRDCLKDVPVEDQGAIGACVGCATATAMEYLKDGCSPALPPDNDTTHTDFSRLYLYYGARYIAGYVNVDAGCQIRDAIRVVAKQGVPEERYWPYNTAMWAKQPSAAAFENGRKNKAIDYRRVIGLIQTKQAIAMGYPVIFGMILYTSFEKSVVHKTGAVPFPQRFGLWRERAIGGHCMLAVGYDDNMPYTGAKKGNGCVIVRNSWGDDHGDKGHLYIPYPCFEIPSMVSDSWTVVRGEFL